MSLTTPRLHLPYPTPDDPADVPADIHALALALDSILPAGMVVPFAGNTEPASGWLLCDGRAVLRATYDALFAAVGTAYGAGNGTTTFNLPDLRGRVPVGADSMGTAAGAANRLPNSLRARGQTGGAEQHGHTGTTPAHAHSATMPAHTHNHAGVDHLHGAGSLYAANHSHGMGERNSDVGPVNTGAGATMLPNLHHTHPIYGSGNVGVGGATGAADRSLSHPTLGVNESRNFNTGNPTTSLGFTTSDTSGMQPYQVANFLIKT